jgi:hypothetical protein
VITRKTSKRSILSQPQGVTKLWNAQTSHYLKQEKCGLFFFGGKRSLRRTAMLITLCRLTGSNCITAKHFHQSSVINTEPLGALAPPADAGCLLCAPLSLLLLLLVCRRYGANSGAVSLNDELDALSHDCVVLVVEKQQQHVCIAPAQHLLHDISLRRLDRPS